jgi:hypothetical protein
MIVEGTIYSEQLASGYLDIQSDADVDNNGNGLLARIGDTGNSQSLDGGLEVGIYCNNSAWAAHFSNGHTKPTMILTNGYGGGGSCNGDTKAPVLTACKGAAIGDDIPIAYATIYNNGDADFDGNLTCDDLTSSGNITATDILGYSRPVYPDLVAWGHFDGTASSPAVTSNSRNIDSVVKNGTGEYKVTLSYGTLYNDPNIMVSGRRNISYGTSFAVEVLNDTEFIIRCYTTNLQSKADYELVSFTVHTL